ncbi:unnamed protein product [Brassicogethes aeneus]|uniref:Uncharacterized protein n=1 Tax=Brassicogethes aeneus TaxID=1431903 RepID=A0A9P0FGZ6_BRAAE|nr:unnamed protein product [Brassicogethes aeneus]
MLKLTVLFALFGCGLLATVLPSYLEPCQISDKKCLTDHAQSVLKSILNGDPQFKIPTLNPLLLPKVDLSSNGGLHIVFSNLQVKGIPDIKITSVEFNPVKKSGKVVFFYPRTELYGDYMAYGKILVLTINASDIASVVVEEGLYTWTFNYDLYDKNGAQYAKIKDHCTQFKLKKAKFDLKNVVNGNAELSAATNKILNDEWETVIKDLADGIGEAIGSVLNLILQAFMDKLLFSELVKL